jgi:hypothetical protein
MQIQNNSDQTNLTRNDFYLLLLLLADGSPLGEAFAASVVSLSVCGRHGGGYVSQTQASVRHHELQPRFHTTHCQVS